MYFRLQPEQCGRFGRKTLYGGELTDTPPQIYRLHLEFDTYPKDELVEVNCIFVGTAALTETVKALVPRVTGVVFEEVYVTTSPDFRQVEKKELPDMKWFKITGKPGVNDFGISVDHQLVVSEPVLAAIKPKIANCQTSLLIKGDASKE